MLFTDLFAGLGGFNLALWELGHECVFASEIDETLRDIYRINFGLEPAGDIRNIAADKVPPHPKLEDAYIAALEIENAIARELQPGKSGKRLFELSESIGAELGYQDYLGGTPGNKCGFVGHGVGLELDEYPVIGPLEHTIQCNMTIAIEPKMIYPDKGVLGVEDTFLTTSNGSQRLTGLSQEIWQV